MEIQNQVAIDAEPSIVYHVLTTPDYLLKTMPGLKQLTPEGENRFQAVLELGVAAVRGRYTGIMSILDPEPPHRYRLAMEGKGPGAFVNLSMDIAIDPTETGSMVQFQGTAQVGGTIAGVGQRIMSGVANMVLGQFFQAVAKEAMALKSSS